MWVSAPRTLRDGFRFLLWFGLVGEVFKGVLKLGLRGGEDLLLELVILCVSVSWGC